MKSILLLFAAAVYSVHGEQVTVLDQCKYKVEPVGCFHDSYPSRAMPEQILNARDTTSNSYSGYIIDWNNYHSFLQKFICDCSKKAFGLGYKAIGIQFYGECWSGQNAHETFATHGKSTQCTHQDMTKAYENSYRDCEDDIVCSGVQLTNYVYRVAPTACSLYYEPVGCYKDDLVKPRPLPHYVQNERDYTIPNYNGHLIDWGNWNTYSPAMICRCAKKAKSLNYTHFGLQFYGECWAGSSSEKHIFRAGKQPKEKCLAQDFKPCPYNSYRCIGKAKTNAVYRFIEGPKADTKSDTNTPTDPHPNHAHHHNGVLVPGHGNGGSDEKINVLKEKPLRTPDSDFEEEDEDVNDIPVEVEEDEEEDVGDRNDVVDDIMDEDK